MFRIIFFSLILLSTPVHAGNKNNLTKLSLQLLWLHQFEFAGYYIAKEKGFYEDVGLDVELKEYQQGLDITKAVLSGESDFGIGNSSLILDKLNKKPVYLLAAILQKSPFILLSIKRDDLKVVADLKNKKIMLESNQMNMAALSAMLKVNNIFKHDFIKQKHTFNVKELLQKNADAMSAYISNEPYLLKQLGGEPQIFNPVDYGFSFYSDILFTSAKFYQKNKNISDKFYQASIKGWHYAFENINETAELIYNKYNSQNKTLAHLIFEAKELKKLSIKEGVNFGEFKLDLINQIIQTYKLLEINNENLVDYNFIYPPALHQESKFNYSLLWKILLIIFILLAGLYYWNRKLAKLNKTIAKNSKKISILLDNAGQGFLTFNSDFSIDSEYSKECVKIFKKEIVGENIADLLHLEPHKKDFFKETLLFLLKETNKLKIKTILSLLQNEFFIHKKAIHIEYKILEQNKFMLILTDITRRKILEKKVNREKNTLKMIVAVVSDSEEFFELISDFNALIINQQSFIDNTKTPLHNATNLYRMIHTFKGLFLQKEMHNIVANLHKLESTLSSVIASQNYSNDKLQALIDESNFEQRLLKDTRRIKKILGDDFFSKRGKIIVDEDSLSQIEEQIIQIAQTHNELEKYEDVISNLKNLKYKTLSNMFSSYPKLLDQLSVQMDKSLYPLDVIVDKDLKVSDRIKPLVKSLVHVFRNSVDHGIESMEKRIALGKDEVGTISCNIHLRNHKLHIIIADDGAGLDSEKIKHKADVLGIQTENLAKHEIEALIFNDRLSTKENISQISGRGVGMAAVKSEMDKLNAEIKINSQENIGTTFEFIVPL